MSTQADAIVIGTGIFGASTAHFLAKAQVGNVLLLEKGELCSGSTKYSSGVIRQHYSNEVTIRLAMRALEMFENSEDELGGPSGFVPCGYLVMAPEGEEDETIGAVVPLQQSLGVETTILSPEEVTELYPMLNVEGVALAALERRSGYADPLQTVQSLVSSAVDKWNLTVRERTEVLEIEVEDGSVAGVVTSQGRISTPIVVNCAGAWAPRVASTAGISYSMAISREHVAVFEVPEQLAALPLVADSPQRLYFRPDGPGRLHLGRTYPKDIEPCDPDSYDEHADPAVVRSMAERLVNRVPSLRELLGSDDEYGGHLLNEYSSFYEITDDWHPIVGGVEEVDGYYAAVGGSGHGFKIGPAIGEALADIITGREPKVDLTPLGHERFSESVVLSSAWGPGSRA